MMSEMAQPPVIKRWTRRSQPSGWLRIRLEPSGDAEYLCEYTGVAVVGVKDGRTFFKVMDGSIGVGNLASLSTVNAAKFLSDKPPAGAATVTVKYRGEPTRRRSMVRGDEWLQQWAVLTFAGQSMEVTLNSVWGFGFTPLVPGTHAILAPDWSHAKIPTTIYVNATPGMVGNDTWFPIGLRGSPQASSRYIHVGHVSEGCVTAYDLKKWTALYTYLISHRVPGSAGRRVGQLIVQK